MAPVEHGLFCPVCGDVVGVYEPVVVSDSGFMRATSLAAEPRLSDGAEIVMHRACALASGVEQARV